MPCYPIGTASVCCLFVSFRSVSGGDSFMFLFALFTAIASGTGVTASVRKAGSMVRDSIWGTLLVCWKLWPVANLINFAFVPANLRVLFMNFVGLGWNIFLSSAVN